MTDVDTALIRAEKCGAPYCGPCHYHLPAVLDALDAARAERDTAIDAFRLNIKAQLFPGDWMPWKARAEAAEAAAKDQADRAEAAEAERDHWRIQAAEVSNMNEAAEARIAAALAVCDLDPIEWVLAGADMVEEIRRALTGGTDV
jgi:hypothetical protein